MERIAFQEIRIGYYEITEFYYSIEEMAPPPTSCYFSYQNGFLIAVETETDTGNAYACVSTYNEPYSGLCQSAYYDVPISTPYPKLIVTQSYSCYDPGYVNQSYQYLQFDGAEEIDLTKTLKYSDLPFTSNADSGLVYVNISFELVTPQ